MPSDQPPRPLIDAHLDLAWNAVSMNRDLTASLEQINQREEGLDDHPARSGAMVSLPAMRSGRVVLCLGTVLARADAGARDVLRTGMDSVTPAVACAVAQGHLAYYHAMQRQGHLRIIDSIAALDAHWTACLRNQQVEPPGVIVSMEGADPILDADHLQQWWQLGLRVVGLTHFGQGTYAGGTGTDAGLAPAARPLLRALERLGIALDITHLSDPAFDEAVDAFGGPLLASHHNCRALVPDPRQLSDEQVRTLIGRDAVIGVAMDNWMLCPGYQRGRTPRGRVTLAHVADHVDQVCQLAGDCVHVGIGSDLDGGFGRFQCPADLGSIADIQRLGRVLADRGYIDEAVDAIFHGNWLRLLQRVLPTGDRGGVSR